MISNLYHEVLCGFANLYHEKFQISIVDSKDLNGSRRLSGETHCLLTKPVRLGRKREETEAEHKFVLRTVCVSTIVS